MEDPSQVSPEPPRERRRLQLKPRDEAAAAKAALERASAKQSLFGGAKPREVALAGRAGKTEEEILQEELAKDKLQLRLTPDQIQAKRSAEANVAEAQNQLDEAEDDKKADAASELAEQQQKLDQLIQSFQEVAVQRAKSGEGIRPSERRRLAEEAQGMQSGPPPNQGGAPHGGPGSRQQFAGSRGGFQGGYEGFSGPRPGQPQQSNWSRGTGGSNGYGSDGPPGDAVYSSFGGRNSQGPAYSAYNGGTRAGRGRGGRGRSYSGEASDFAADAPGGGLPGMEGDFEYAAQGPASRQDRF